jgi:hypothetical protein
VTGLLPLALAWFLLSIPCTIFIGKCIRVGQAGEEERHAAGAVSRAGADEAEAPSAGPSLDIPALPTQRDPVTPLRQHAEVVASD